MGGKGAIQPQIFRKYSPFVLWEAFSKQNSVIRLKTNILILKSPPQNFCAGYATELKTF